MNDPNDEAVKSYLADIQVELPSVWASPVEKVTFLSHISVEDTLKVERNKHLTMAQTLLKPKVKKIKIETSTNRSRSRSVATFKNTSAETKILKAFSPSLSEDPSSEDDETGKAKKVGADDEETTDTDNNNNNNNEDEDEDEDEEQDKAKDSDVNVDKGIFIIFFRSADILSHSDQSRSRSVTPPPPPPGQGKRPLRMCHIFSFPSYSYQLCNKTKAPSQISNHRHPTSLVRPFRPLRPITALNVPKHLTHVRSL